MRILTLLLLIPLAACGMFGGIMDWADCAMPTYSGERPDCKRNEAAAAQAQNSARPPTGNLAAMPAANAAAPSMMPPPHMGQSTNTAESMPHNFSTTSLPSNAPPKPEDDFPAEYRDVKPGIDPTYDLMIPPPPI